MSEQEASLYQCVCAKCKDKFFHEDKRCPICQLCHALNRCEILCAQLTAAQQRVAELEQQLANSDQLCREMCRNTFDANERLTADNARLRELLQLWVNYFEHSNDEVVQVLLRTSNAELTKGE